MKINIKDELLSKLFTLSEFKNHKVTEERIAIIIDDLIKKNIDFLNFDSINNIKDENRIENDVDKSLKVDVDESKDSLKYVNSDIDYYLWKRISDFIKERMLKKDNRITSFNSFVTNSLISYRDGMELTYQINKSRLKRSMGAKIKNDVIEIYDSFPIGRKREYVERILGTYLEIVERKENLI